MADRTVYGLTNSENGWRMVDQDSCVWVKVPGTSVTLQIREGQPASIMGAFAADFNAYVEPLRDADSACWTATNSVASSNHLSGTAMDLNWGSHPFKIENAGFDSTKLATVRELLGFYEEMIWWGNDWNSPKDAMHFQMGYDTYGSQNVDKVQSFIGRKIRADGFSTFRRGGTVTPPPVVVTPPASNQVDVLARATGVTTAKAQAILVGVVNGLRDSQCDNANRIAMWLAQIGHESAGFNATEEYASGSAYEGRGDLGNTQPGDGVRFKGRTWIQITGRSNYAALSKWAFGKGVIPSATYFTDDSTRLADIQYAGLGPAWYWTVARPQINSLCDARNLYAVTQAINGGQSGAADRGARYSDALELGDQLLALITSAPTGETDDMASVPQDQWDRVYRELTQKLPSRSPLRHLGEGLVDTMAGFVLNTDGSQHVEVVKLLAGYGHADSIKLLAEVAGADPVKFPDRQADAAIAQAILADIEATNPAVLKEFLKGQS
jgi:putative chitinase